MQHLLLETIHDLHRIHFRRYNALLSLSRATRYNNASWYSSLATMAVQHLLLETIHDLHRIHFRRYNALLSLSRATRYNNASWYSSLATILDHQRGSVRVTVWG